MNEGYYFIDKFGNEFHFTNFDTTLIGRSGFGNPEIDYSRTKGYQQDGSTIQNFKLRDRSLLFRVFKENRNFEEYEDYRQRLMSFFNPLKAPYKFCVTKLSGKRYELWDVFPESGITFSNDEYNSSYIIDEQLQMTATNPVWINPEVKDVTFSSTLSQQLVFPITFPIEFGTDNAIFSSSITYNGTYTTEPIITVTGGYSTVTFINTYNGATVTLNQQISTFERRIINFEKTKFSVVDGFGNNKITDVTSSSKPIDFFFFPNTTLSIEVQITNPVDNPVVTVEYYEKFIGI